MRVTYTTLSHRYSESAQKNPIRWMLLKHDGNGSFTNTTNAFKCKDYFNDFVIYKQLGKEFSVHGMPSNAACFEDGSLYVLVYGLFDQFEQNVKNVIEPSFGEKWGCKFEITRVPPENIDGLSVENAAIIKFSPECFVSTFRISCLSLFLRNCNVPYIVPDYCARLDQLFATEADWTPAQYKFFMQQEWVYPLQEEYVWYINETYNNIKSNSPDNYTLHDNGINAWMSDLRRYNAVSSYNFWRTLPILGAPLPESHDRASWDTDEDEDEGEEYYDEECEES